MTNASPSDRDLLAKYQNAKYRCEDRHAIAEWLLSFMQRVNGSASSNSLQEEWSRLRLALRLATEVPAMSNPRPPYWDQLIGRGESRFRRL